jgi:hypothetical protein
MRTARPCTARANTRGRDGRFRQELAAEMIQTERGRFMPACAAAIRAGAGRPLLMRSPLRGHLFSGRNVTAIESYNGPVAEST